MYTCICLRGLSWNECRCLCTGQKASVSLARCVNVRPKIALFSNLVCNNPQCIWRQYTFIIIYYSISFWYTWTHYIFSHISLIMYTFKNVCEWKDDVFSAIDAATGKFAFERRLFESSRKTNLFSGTAILHFTHATHFLIK